MPRKKTTLPAADPSGFDVPPPAPTTAAPLAAKPPAAPAGPEPDEEPTEAPSSAPQPSTINAQPSKVIVPKQAFLRMQKLQTAKARQEQLRILARKHPVVRDLLKQLNTP